MKKTKFALSFLAAFLFVITCATAGQAFAPRTFVAGPGIGNDANTASDCPFSAPCRFFSAAYSVTNIGGEIIALSPGAGYGGLTITHSITITGLPGQVAFVAVTAGGTGFTVSAPVADLIVIRNITFNGSNAGSTTGLSETSGRVVVEGCTFTQLTTGINIVNAKMDLRNSTIVGNGTGARVQGTGTDGGGASVASALLTVSGGDVSYNGTGFITVDPGANPIFNILVQSTGSSWFTNFMGNTTAVSGSGIGCPCSNVNTYTNNNPH